MLSLFSSSMANCPWSSSVSSRPTRLRLVIESNRASQTKRRIAAMERGRGLNRKTPRLRAKSSRRRKPTSGLKSAPTTSRSSSTP